MKLLTGCSFGCEKLQYRKIEVLSTLKLPALIFKVLQKKNMEFSSKLVVAVYYYNCYLVSMVCGFADTQKRDENSIFANFDGAYLALAFSFPGYLCKKKPKKVCWQYILSETTEELFGESKKHCCPDLCVIFRVWTTCAAQNSV